MMSLTARFTANMLLTVRRLGDLYTAVMTKALLPHMNIETIAITVATIMSAPLIALVSSSCRLATAVVEVLARIAIVSTRMVVWDVCMASEITATKGSLVELQIQRLHYSGTTYHTLFKFLVLKE